MKKTTRIIFSLLILVFASVALIACGNKDAKAVEDAKAELEIQFTGDETSANVTQNVTLLDKVGEVVVTWETSDATVISLTGEVVRKEVDKTITLTATLTKGKESDTKEFELKVIKAEDPQKGKDALVSHYEDTLLNAEYLVTEDVTLVSELEGFAITWEVVSGQDNFTVGGKVTRPSYTEGNASVQLRATIGGSLTQNFFFNVEKLEETTEEKIQTALNLVTIAPETSSGYQEDHFEAVATVKIDGNDVDVTWESSDLDAMGHDGKLVVFYGEEDKVVTMTASITLDEVTLTKAVEFKLAPMTSMDNITGAFTTDNIDEKLYIEGVSVFRDISSGYYLISNDGSIAYINGKRDNKDVPEGKVFDVIATVDEYYGSYQLKDISVLNERDEAETTPTYVLKTFDEVVEANTPSKSNMFNHYTFELENVKIYVDPEAETNYNTFIVKQDFVVGTDVVSKSNAIMVYYPSEIDALRSLDGTKIDSIKSVLSGYRSDKLVWYTSFFDEEGDLEFSLTDTQALAAAEAAIKADVEAEYVKNGNLTLQAENNGVTIAWASSHPAIVALNGTITIPETGTQEVTLTATLSIGTEDDVVVTLTTLVGEPDVIDLADLKLVEDSETKHYKVVATIGQVSANGTITIQDATGGIAIYDWDHFDNLKAAIGKKVTIIGTKGSHNGLNQLGNLQVVEISEEAGTVIVAEDISTLLGTNLEIHQSSLVSVLGAVVVEKDVDSYNNVTLTLELNGQTIVVRADDRVIEIANNDLNDLVVGDKVNITAPLTWSKAPQIGFSNNDQLEKLTQTDEEKLVFAKSSLELFAEAMGTNQLDLPATGNLGSTITWAVDDEVTAVIADNKVTFADVATNTTVVFTATIKLGALEETKDFTVVVGPLQQEATANYAGDTGNFVENETANQAALINLDEDMFTVTGSVIDGGTYTNPIGVNKDGSIRLYASRSDGKGNKLSITIKTGYEITAVVFNFEEGKNNPTTGTLTLGEDTQTLAAADLKETSKSFEGLSIDSFSLRNAEQGDTSTQIWIGSIVITYKEK